MKLLKRTLSLLLVLVLVLAMVPSAFAATEIEEKDTYVLKRTDLTGDAMGPNLLYTSLYLFQRLYNGAAKNDQVNIYNMYDTRTLETIPVYCTDITTEAVAGMTYRRLNLEDSSFSSSAAGLIRAILMNGFYVEEISGESSTDHENRARAAAAALGKAAGIEGADLTVSEAISATQFAIWQAAHGSTLVFNIFVRNYLNATQNNCKYWQLCQEDFRSKGHVATTSGYASAPLTADSIAKVEGRIRQVYDYLLDLEPMPANPRIASPASFIKLNDPVFTPNSSDGYTVTVTTTLDVDMQASDDLTVKAAIHNGDTEYSDTIDLKNSGKQDLSFSFDIPASLVDQPVRLSIYGEQTASGVFLFDAEGDRGESQTMVARSSHRLPVYASVLATKDRVLNFYKTSRNTPTRQPLEGIVFDIYPAATMEEYMSGNANLPDPANYTLSELLNQLDLPTLPEFTVITGKDGRASLNFTQFNIPDGVYLVVERDHPAIVAPLPPFYVMIPNIGENGIYDYEVTLAPKNDVKGGVYIEKNVIDLDTTEGSVDAYKNHTWIISASIPDDMADCKSYVITDTLDNRLDYMGNLKVTVETADGETVKDTLEDTDYKLTLTDVNSLEGEKLSDAFTLALTEDGKAKVAAAVGAGSFADYRLRVYYDAKVNANAKVAENIPNEAKVRYTSSVGIKYNAASNEPYVYMGAVNLLKVDAGDHTKVLPGAVFELYRPATVEELDAGKNLVSLKGVTASVVKVPFFTSADMTGDKVSSVTSGADGKITLYGLAHGTYYLVETQPPTGYNLMGDPLQLTINEVSHKEENTILLENSSGAVLPETGGIGTTVFTTSGILLMGFSILLILTKKRRTAN